MWPKTYLVKISGKPSDDQIEKLRRGIMLPAERAPLKTAGRKLRRRTPEKTVRGGEDRAGTN